MKQDNSAQPSLLIFLTIGALVLLVAGCLVGTFLAPQLNLVLPTLPIQRGDMAISNAFASSVQTPRFWYPVSGVGEGIYEEVGSQKHTGPDQYAIDWLWTNEGVDVYPTLPGRVVYSDCPDDYGCTVVVRHWDDARWDKKYYSVYAHLQPNSMVPVWAIVDGTFPIGRMGKTGRGSNGIIHLHFAVRSSNDVLDGTNALYGINQSAFDVRPYLW